MNEIQAAVEAYIDSMPKRSRVNYPELVESVRETNNVAWNFDLVDAIAHEVVSCRDDVRVEKGRGIVKMK